MRHISFAWTSAALVAGHKTVTRRGWSLRYAAAFRKGELVTAYSKDPRAGGRPIATIRLTANPYTENTSEMPESDYQAEGLAWLWEHTAAIPSSTPIADASPQMWAAWRAQAVDMTVIRFELVEVRGNLPGSLRLYSRDRLEPAGRLL